MKPDDKMIDALEPLVRRMRTDVTARKAKKGSVWTREPLTRTLLAQHLNGGPARGCSPIKAGEESTMVGLADLDSHKGETPWLEMVRVAQLLMDELQRRGLRPIAFRSSGGKGIHIIVIWDDPQCAYSVRMVMRAALEAIGFTDGAAGVARGEVEIFPKQNSVSADGFGNMFILPLAGESVPLEPLLDLQPMDKEHALCMEWPSSDPVPRLERPERSVGDDNDAAGDRISIDVLRSALDAIPNSGDQELAYEGWRDIIFAIHYETGGSDEGLELAREFSAKSSKWDGGAWLERRTWPYIRNDRASGDVITGRSVLRMADGHGWQDPSEVFTAIDDGPGVGGTAGVDFDDDDDLTGLGAAGLAAIGLLPGAGGAGGLPAVIDDSPPNGMQRDQRGAILASMGNLALALGAVGFCGMDIRFDEFRDEIVWAEPGQHAYRAFLDADYSSLRLRLEGRGFKPIGREIIRDIVLWIAERNRFDTAIEWLDRLAWDGVPRVEMFLTNYLMAEDSAYVRAVSRYMWSAVGGRVMDPGCKADMVPIFIGPQGIGKSSAVAALVPAPQFFSEIALGDKDDDLSRKMRGCLVGEIGELRGLHTRELETIKAFLTRTHEKWTPKYREFAVQFPRRLIFIGTTNENEFLADPSGHRRMLPVKVGRAALSDLVRDRDQLWAEAREIWKKNGIEFANAEKLARSVHDDHLISDPWLDVVEKWLQQMDPMTGKKNADCKFLHGTAVLKDALGVEHRSISRREEMRISKVLQELGFDRQLEYVGGRRMRVHVRRLEQPGTTSEQPR